MKVWIGDYEDSFSEVATEEEVAIKSKEKKNASAEDIETATHRMLSRTSERQGSRLFLGIDSDDDQVEGQHSGELIRNVVDEIAAGPNVRSFVKQPSFITPSKKKRQAMEGPSSSEEESARPEDDDQEAPTSGRKKKSRSDKQ